MINQGFEFYELLVHILSNNAGLRAHVSPLKRNRTHNLNRGMVINHTSLRFMNSFQYSTLSRTVLFLSHDCSVNVYRHDINMYPRFGIV